MAFPLTGVKVLDFSRVLAGPFAGRMLNDLGADVVKLEPPEGDVTRLWGRKIAGISGYYNQQNAGKRNVSINLREPKGVELAKQLVKEADIVIENFRPDVMPRLGLGYETLAEINPRLIMLSISGFGAGNAESRRAAYAPIVHAESGLIARHAQISGSFPTDLPTSLADTNASLHGLVGLLSALYAREQTGVGEHIDIAMIDATLTTYDGAHYVFDEMGRPPPNEVFETAGGPLMLAGEFRYIWHQLHNVLGLEDGLSGDEPLETKIAVRREKTQTFFNETCAGRAEVIAALDQMNIAWGDVRDAKTVRELPSVQARQSITEVDDRAGGTRSVPQSPYRFKNAEAHVRGGAPHLGEHNQEVLRDWLGLEGAAVSAFDDVLVSGGDSE